MLLESPAMIHSGLCYKTFVEGRVVFPALYNMVMVLSGYFKFMEVLNLNTRLSPACGKRFSPYL